MFKLSIRTWVRNAAAVFSNQHGSVTEQAEESQCSRETVYQHARKVEARLAEASRGKSRLAEQEAENQQLQRRIAELEERLQQPVVWDPLQQRQFGQRDCCGRPAHRGTSAGTRPFGVPLGARVGSQGHR